MRACRFTAPSCGFRYAPEEGQRPLHNTRDVLAPRRVTQEEAGRRIDDVIESRLVEASGHSLLLIEVFGVEPCHDFLFHGLARRPAKPSLVAIGANGVIDR